MGESAVNTYTHNLGVNSLEVIDYGFEAGNFPGSSRRPIEGIEHEHDVLLSFELAESELGSAKMARQLKIGRRLSNTDHDDAFLLKNLSVQVNARLLI
jgi:hypothetical protein